MLNAASAPALSSHHVRQLHWRADTHDAASADRLRHAVEQRGERVAQALAAALDRLDPGASRTLHVRRLTLSLDPSWLEQSDDELSQRVAQAVRRAWMQLQPAALAGPLATGGGMSRPISLPEATAGLCRYLETGVLPPAFEALELEERGRTMQHAAALLAGTGDLLRLGGRAGSFDQRVDWFGRWLALWAEADRARWLARRFDPSPTLTDPIAADVLEQLERLLPRLAGEPLVAAQAVWLAATSPGPVSFDPLRRANELAVRDSALAGWLARLSTARPGGEPLPAAR